MNVKWSEKEKNFVRDNYQNMKDQEVADCLGKSLQSVRKMRQRLGAKKKQGRACGTDVKN